MFRCLAGNIGSSAGKVGFIKDSEELASHREALGYTLDCIVIMLKRQGLHKDDQVSPEEVTQVRSPVHIFSNCSNGLEIRSTGSELTNLTHNLLQKTVDILF